MVKKLSDITALEGTAENLNFSPILYVSPDFGDYSYVSVSIKSTTLPSLVPPSFSNGLILPDG